MEGGVKGGQWYYPNNESMVEFMGFPHNGDFYRNRGLSVVRLNRRNDVLSPTGIYRCEIPVDQDYASLYIGVYNTDQGISNYF